MNWRTVRLEEICEINMGKTPSRNNLNYWGGTNSWVSIADLKGEVYINKTKECITDEGIKVSGIKSVPPNTLLYSFKLSIGKVAITNKIIYTNEAIVALPILDTNKLDLKYFYWAMQVVNISGIGDKAVMGLTLNKEKLKQLQIPLPPLPVQQRIAAILDAADALRRKDRELLKKYDELAQAIFIDMFGDPVKNEKGWETVNLGNLTEISSGSTPSRSDEKNFFGSIPWVKTGEVNGRIILETEEKISENALKKSSCKLYPSGSIIVAMYGQGKTRGQVGLLGITATTNQACAVLPPNDNINFKYLYNLLKLLYNDLRSLGRGGNQPNLNAGLLKNYHIINPPIFLQDKFVERIQLIEKQKELKEETLIKSEKLFQVLIKRNFN